MYRSIRFISNDDESVREFDRVDKVKGEGIEKEEIEEGVREDGQD